MEELLKQCALQVPALVVLCVLVRQFLKHDRDRDVFIKQLHEEHIIARHESRDAILDNTRSNLEVTSAIRALEKTLGNCQRMCKLNEEPSK